MRSSVYRRSRCSTVAKGHLIRLNGQPTIVFHKGRVNRVQLQKACREGRVKVIKCA